MFGNSNATQNGEIDFYHKIRKEAKIIFDVGARDSFFLDFEKEVHYFDPIENFIEKLKNNSNSQSFYNIFGLGNKNGDILYYPRYQSFHNRKTSCKIDDSANSKKLKIRKGIDYIKDNNIDAIDFLKIDTEGHEFEVLKGFEDKISIVKIIEFEYGGTFKDTGVKLIDVINYLKNHGFGEFSYLHKGGRKIITDFRDHYKYCNIVCKNSRFSNIIF